MSNSTPSLLIEEVAASGWNQMMTTTAPLSHSSVLYSSATRVGPWVYFAGYIGQKNEPVQCSAVIAVLNIKFNTWKHIPFAGVVAQGAGMFLYEDSLYTLGYQSRFGQGFGRLARFDMALREWSYCHTAGEESPGQRAFFAGHFLERLKYYAVFGGAKEPTKNDIHVLDLTVASWIRTSVKGKPPRGRIKAGSCVHHGVIYILGGLIDGRRRNDGLHLLEVEYGGRATWSKPKTNALDFGPRSSFSYIPLRGVLLMLGGVPHIGTREVTYYDPEEKEFRKLDIGKRLLKLFQFGECWCPIEDGKSVALFFARKAGASYIRVSIVA